MPGLVETLNRLQAMRREACQQRETLLNSAEQEGRTRLTAAETTEFRTLTATVDGLEERIIELGAEVQRAGLLDPDASRIRAASSVPSQGGHADDRRAWAERAATAIQRMGGGGDGLTTRAMTSGSVDVPHLLAVGITPLARPTRLVDLLVNRITLEGNAFEYFRQTVRTNNAAPVADSGLKPTSVVTTTAVTDRARVVAHLSEATPQRLLMDVPGLQEWLWSEMAEGVLDALEDEVIAGAGTGEHFTGILTVAGTTAVAYATDVPTTLRKALTAAQTAGDTPTAIVLSPADAETLDLSRWGASGGYLLPDALTATPGGNVLGPESITRVVSPSMPTGTAVLADWSKVLLGIRESVRVDIDLSGDNFTHNTFVARAEGRFGVGVLRPASFYKIDLTA
jgi:HK97 family phage major capsid protein